MCGAGRGRPASVTGHCHRSSRSAELSVAGLVLAAGGGRRYGGPKALVRHEGTLLVERAVA
ncbi:MAG: NTP transferase domain-containing protein, partial [Micromonosporaceae bacterium]